LRETISVENRIAMLLQRLRSGNTLCNVGEVYGLVESIILSIVRNFYKLNTIFVNRRLLKVSKSNMPIVWEANIVGIWNIGNMKNTRI
jgi:hypothetical protein